MMFFTGLGVFVVYFICAVIFCVIFYICLGDSFDDTDKINLALMCLVIILGMIFSAFIVDPESFHYEKIIVEETQP